jgi:soluble lytic murein transglycosylase-like protein
MNKIAFACASFLASAVPVFAYEGHADFFRKDRERLSGQSSSPPVRAGIKRAPPPHLDRMVTDAAKRHGVPPRIAHAVIATESGYRCDARSRSGARGIAQVMPATARGVGVHGNLFDCSVGLEAGMRYLSYIIRKHGHGCAAISLYERGAYARPVCTKYGRTVLSRAM